MPTLQSPEDAARHYDMAGLDGWIDDAPEGGVIGDVLFALSLLSFAAFAIFGGLLLAALTSGR